MGPQCSHSSTRPILRPSWVNARSSTDDIAYCSFFYPEGSANSGPAKLQRGDKAFNKEFGLIKGELRHGILNQAIAGGNVFAVDLLSDKRIASAFSGTTQVSFNPATGGLAADQSRLPHSQWQLRHPRSERPLRGRSRSG